MLIEVVKENRAGDTAHTVESVHLCKKLKEEEELHIDNYNIWKIFIIEETHIIIIHEQANIGETLN